MSIRSRWREFLLGVRPTLDELRFTAKQVRKSPLSILGLGIIAIFAAIAIFAPILAPPVGKFADPYVIFTDGVATLPKPPGTPVSSPLDHLFGWTVHWFGVAQGGLDIYYGCIWGTRTAFMIGVLVIAFSLIVGVAFGALAGYYGGVIDELLMRFTDIVLAFPGLILAMALVIALPGGWPIPAGYWGLAIVIFLGLIIAGHSMRLRGILSLMLGVLGLVAFVIVNTYVLGSPPIFMVTIGLSAVEKIMIALALVGWPGYTRVIRGEILRIKQEDYVEASKAVGCSDFRIILNHILPNAIYPILIMASLDIGGVVLTAAALSFLGIGEPLGYADWGQMVSLAESWVGTGRSLLMYWYVWVIPGVFIFIFVMGWNLLGDAFRDILDPTLRRR